MQGKKIISVVAILVFITALTRLIPHEWNFSPIAAMALFGGAYFWNKKYALILPLLCLFISDLLLQGKFAMGLAEYPAFFSGTIWIYGTFLMIVGLGIVLFKNHKITLPKVIGGSIMASILFFVLTNFAAWATDHQYYPVKNFESLMYAYELGIPFFRGTLVGDLVWSGVLFGGFAMIKNFVLSESLIPQPIKSK